MWSLSWCLCIQGSIFRTTDQSFSRTTQARLVHAQATVVRTTWILAAAATLMQLQLAREKGPNPVPYLVESAVSATFYNPSVT